MTKDKVFFSMCFLSCLGWMGCNEHVERRFDNLDKTASIGNWIYRLYVEDQTQQSVNKGASSSYHYLKATLSMSNSKTKNSLLYSASRNKEEYEGHYKVLAFKSGEDLYLKHGDQTVYPIGYVFEPSNGLVPEERLVYKFALSPDQYNTIYRSNSPVSYWYTDHLVGLGKICFNAQN